MSCCNSNCNHDPCGSSFNQKLTMAAQYASYAQTQSVKAENLWEEFNALYLGAFAVAPTQDNEGNPLQVGALYWNIGGSELYAWNGLAWETSTGFNEFTPFLSTGSTTPRNLAARMADVINVKDFGAIGNGIADDTAAIQAAINLAFGKTVIIPAGTYIVTQLFGINKVSIIGEGSGVSILKRKNNSSTQSILEFSGKNDFQVTDITFDGNKANQAVGASSLVITTSYSWEVIGCSFINAKSVSGYGSGIVVSDGQNDTLIYRSKIKDCFFENNDGAAIYINKEWFVDITGNLLKNNAAGLSVINYVFPPVSNVQNYLIIDKNTCISNTTIGISVFGYIQGGTPSNPEWGPFVPQSREVIISNNNCKSNGTYGIAYQGSNGIVSGNNCELNGASSSGFAGGGFLFNAYQSVFTNNTGTNNYNYGVDAGGSYYSTISNNSFVLSEGAGIGAGASVFDIISNNTIVATGGNQIIGIGAPGIDGTSNIDPFNQRGFGTKISGNVIILNSSPSSSGIFSTRIYSGLTVENNLVQTPVDINRAFIFNISNFKSNNNEILSGYSPFFSQLYYPIASASTLIIPDNAETFFVTGTTNITNIYTYSEWVFLQRVLDVSITNTGSGYTPGSSVSVTFSGGGGGSGAAATAAVSSTGNVVGVNMTNYGSGYTVAPSVVINGSGIGATGTALVGCEPPVGREITILFTGVLTVQDAVGNLNLNGNLTTTPSNTTLTLKRSYGNWIEVSRFVG